MPTYASLLIGHKTAHYTFSVLTASKRIVVQDALYTPGMFLPGPDPQIWVNSSFINWADSIQLGQVIPTQLYYSLDEVIFQSVNYRALTRLNLVIP